MSVGRPEDSLHPTLDAIRLFPDGGFSWMGRPYVVDGVSEAEPDRARSLLLEALTSHLYVSVFSTGGPALAREVPVRPWSRLSPFVAALSAANTGTGSWQHGWQVDARDGDLLVVERDGLRLWARSTDVRATDPSPGAATAVRLPNEMLGLSPGFYVALGDEGPEPGEPLIRLYWNLFRDAAAPFVGAATAMLNDARVPFRLKVLNDPALYDRCDAGVLYLERRGGDQVASIIAAVHGVIAEGLGDETPVFTLRLARGLAFAEDPGDVDESFGMNRCALLAEGIVRAHERGEESIAGRLAIVADVFTEAGLSLDRPYLEPGSGPEDVPAFPGLVATPA